MLISLAQIKSIFTGTEQDKITALKSILNYPFMQRDSEGLKFWYLRPGNNQVDALETCPVAVGFYEQLNHATEQEIKQFFTANSQQKIEIQGHYLNRFLENQPVIYLLLPTDKNGKVVLVLPSDTRHLPARNIQIFPLDSPDLLTPFNRLHQDSLNFTRKIHSKLLNFVPQVDWIFFKPAKTASELAIELAKVAQKIEQAIPIVYQKEQESGYLHQLLSSFQKELLPNLKISADNDKDYSFSDIYAQTIVYGLFTARVFSFALAPEADFNREQVWLKLPETNPFLRRLFQDISEKNSADLGDELLETIAEVFGILRVAAMDAILTDFHNNMNREDIVIRFYEDFLAAYKPQMREKRGVYYTPEPVVSYMVRSVDDLIKSKFNKPLGITDPDVMILDPACGTGTFLLWIFQLIYQRFQENPNLLTQGLKDKSWNGYVTECLLPRIFGFELLVAPYSICHLKLGLFLEETGYKFDSGKRLGVYLINTLEDIKLREEKKQFSLDLPQMTELIAEEAKAGARIKKQEPIMVVIGNPPYSGHSENNNDWIKDLMNDYYFVDGIPLGEKNSKWLQDDYVKFIRFAQWRINQTQKGILAFVTNHGFLDNPTFRGMRQHLINSFDSISIYDLHGNSKKKETTLDGSKDENVFDIQQGVSINFMVKNGS